MEEVACDVTVALDRLPNSRKRFNNPDLDFDPRCDYLSQYFSEQTIKIIYY